MTFCDLTRFFTNFCFDICFRSANSFPYYWWTLKWSARYNLTENITEVIQCKFFTNFLDKGILIFMTLYFHEKISLILILLIVHSNYFSMNFIWIFRENAAAMLNISTAFWVTLKYEMQERSRTFCLFLESLLKFRPTFYDQFTFETAIAIVNIPNYKYHHCYYPRSK